MHFLDVEVSVTDQFAAQQEDGNLVTVALANRAFRVDVDDLDVPS